MVSLHRPAAPERIVVKRGRRPSRFHVTDGCACVVCGAELRDGHETGDLVCDCHPHDGYHPLGGRDLDLRVLSYLTAAWPHPLRLARALGVGTFDAAGRRAVERSVGRWRERGVRIVTVRGIGYRLGGENVATRSRGARKVKA